MAEQNEGEQEEVAEETVEAPPVTDVAKENAEFEQKARDLVLLAEQNPEWAKQFVNQNIDNVFITVQSIIDEVKPTLELLNKLRFEKLGQIKRVKMAQQVDKEMKAAYSKYKPLFDQINAHKADIMSSIMFTVKDEYKDEMAKIVGLFMWMLNNVGGQSG